MSVVKYIGIAKRSFKRKLELYLYNEIAEKGKLLEVQIDAFSKFVITQELVEDYERAWQMDEMDEIGGLSVKQIDFDIENWYKVNRNIEDMLFKDYIDSYESVFPKRDFMNFYEEYGEDRKCFYCEISEKEISLLKQNGLIKTKRNRGKQMEIDRRNSNKEYTLDNVILSCYWCNNSKTDEFTPDEFKGIAEGIKQVWAKRLQKVNRG